MHPRTSFRPTGLTRKRDDFPILPDHREPEAGDSARETASTSRNGCASLRVFCEMTDLAPVGRRATDWRGVLKPRQALSER